ncbi:MAG: GMC family oxidoreductase [Solirubrobacterales bacterium]|nr:GMC family oxidoreductase [Solirubrobacterales bacterium]
MRLSADVCVVGAGAGGAVVAAELAEGGADVVLLDRGPRHNPDDLTARPPEMLARLYRDGGQTVTLGSPPVGLPLGSGLGGTTLVNSGTCFRTPPAVLARWAREHGLELDGGVLDPCFERVERALSVGPVTPELAGRNAEVARRGAAALGWSHGYIARNARGCVGSGVCAYGCPASAKQHVGITYVPRAEAAGARVLTGAAVERIAVAGGRARGVEGLRTGRRRVALAIDAPLVVVAAGTVETPLLLARSGLGAASGQLGRNLSLHPATAAFARMDEVVDMARGVPQSLYVDEFAADGIMLEGIAGPPAHAALALPLTGAAHAEAMADYRRLAQFGLMVSDSSRGSVRSVAGRPLVRYDLCDADLARFRTGLARLRELFETAGARAVHLPLPAGVEPRRARRRDLKLMAFHPLGTARADASAERGVVDGDLAVHGVDGVHVADGSVVPSSLGVNPQITIMALATRLALGLLAT